MEPADVDHEHSVWGPSEEETAAISNSSSGEQELTGQFSLLDERPLDEVVHHLMDSGFVPSFCTACYREGRTGAAFMKIAKKGHIHRFCHPNSLLTLQEYLQDYASPRTKDLGEEVIAKERLTIDGPTKALDKKLKRTIEGERDLYF